MIVEFSASPTSYSASCDSRSLLTVTSGTGARGLREAKLLRQIPPSGLPNSSATPTGIAWLNANCARMVGACCGFGDLMYDEKQPSRLAKFALDLGGSRGRV